MSQEKVNRYKEEKKNRKVNMKKEKRKKLLWKIFGPIITIVCIALIGAGIYFVPKWTNQKAEAKQAEEINYDQLVEMIEKSAQEAPAEGSDSNEAE